MYTDHPTPPPAAPVPPVEPQTPPPAYYPPVEYPTPTAQPARSNGLAVASLVLGILALLFSGSTLFAVPAVVLGICSRRGDERLSRLALAGIICAVVGLVLGVLLTIPAINRIMEEMSMLYGE